MKLNNGKSVKYVAVVRFSNDMVGTSVMCRKIKQSKPKFDKFLENCDNAYEPANTRAYRSFVEALDGISGDMVEYPYPASLMFSDAYGVIMLLDSNYLPIEVIELKTMPKLTRVLDVFTITEQEIREDAIDNIVEFVENGLKLMPTNELISLNELVNTPLVA